MSLARDDETGTCKLKKHRRPRTIARLLKNAHNFFGSISAIKLLELMLPSMSQRKIYKSASYYTRSQEHRIIAHVQNGPIHNNKFLQLCK